MGLRLIMRSNKVSFFKTVIGIVVLVISATIITVLTLNILGINGPDKDNKLHVPSSGDSDGSYSITDSILEISTSIEFDGTFVADTDDNQNDKVGKLLEPYKAIVEDGIYKIIITRQRIYGGNSIPVITTVWHSENFTNMVVAEAHNISSEVFINDDGAYFLDSTENTAILYPADLIGAPQLQFNELSFIGSGTTRLAAVNYSFERYMANGYDYVDFLFDNCTLKKIIVYNNTDSELIGFEVSDETDFHRASLPEGLIITDRR